MPDRNPRALNLLPRQARRNTHLQRGLQLPADLLGRGVDAPGHALHPRDQYPVCERLSGEGLAIDT